MKKLSLYFLLAALWISPLTGELEGSAFAQNAHVLWYDKPAISWNEALPIGNARLGAMLFSAPASDRLQLNEETIWAGRPNNSINPPEAKEYLPKVRELVWAGKYKEAQDLANEHVMPSLDRNNNKGMPYQPFGDLIISSPNIGNYTQYYRELSLDSARSVVTFKANGVNYKREYIASLADNVILVHLTADKPGAITCSATFNTPQQDAVLMDEDGGIKLMGTSGWHEGQKGKIMFTGRAKAKAIGGEVTCHDGSIQINGADEATLYITIATNFKKYNDVSGDDKALSKSILDAAFTKSFADIKAAHTAKYKSQFDRVKLTLGIPNQSSGSDARKTTTVPEVSTSGLTTDKRIENFKANQDLQLAADYFQFGRYLLICSSQPGSQPPTLQGIWNDKMLPSWDCKYTCNINAEMNYWPAEVGNLSELTEPLFSMIEDLSEAGQQTAKTMYGADGWVLHHNTDLWRITGAVDRAASGLWCTGAAWLCQHLWEHYLYTGDKEFLRKVYPQMEGAVRFFNDILVREPRTNAWVICPSLSPENEHADHKSTTAGGVTMDNQLLFDLFTHYLQATEILSAPVLEASASSLKDSIRTKLSDLLPLQTGSWGQLQEWMDDWDNPADDHRHVSHLYGMFPSNQISPYRTPELAAAVRTSLAHRGDPSTGWSMGWKVCLWARLLDGNHAWKLIGDQMTLIPSQYTNAPVKTGGGTYPNFLDAHPPFQIDGNFGCAAGIAEMMLQSHDGFVHILPAIPDAWQEGKVSGLKARGGFEIGIEWESGKAKEVTVTSALDGNLRLRSAVPLTMNGKKLKAAKGNNPNPLFDVTTYKQKQQINNPEAIEELPALQHTYLYDIPTKKGQKIVLKRGF